jgi:MFS family permease
VEILGGAIVLGLGLSALANLIVSAVRQEQTGVATGMNTVMRTLGGAFGAQLAATFIAQSAGTHRLPTEHGFTLAFAVCAIGSAVGLLSAFAVPGSRRAKRTVSATSERKPQAA